MVDDEPRNQKVTLSTETINAINEISGDGSSYDTVIQDLCKKEKANKSKTQTAADKRKE
jgi:hypothetical protein